MTDFHFARSDWPPASSRFRYPNSGIVRAADEEQARAILDEFFRIHKYLERASQYRFDDPAKIMDNGTGVIILAMAG